MSILDNIDDILMTHRVDFVEGEDCCDEMGINWVWSYRWLCTENDYYENCLQADNLPDTNLPEVDANEEGL